MNSKLILGDCYEEVKKLPDKSIDLVYIDIPYLVKNMNLGNGSIKKLTGFTLDKGTKRMNTRINTFQEIGKMCDGVNFDIFNELCRVMKNINIYIWCSKEQILDLLNYFVESRKCLFEILVWCKTNPTPFCNNTWLPDIEYCLYFREPRVTKLNNDIKLKSKFYISQTNIKDKKLYKHPTIKPLELVTRHILHSSKENDTVLDCFMGSGTTCVACKKTNRKYIGVEIDKEYYNIAVERINNE